MNIGLFTDSYPPQINGVAVSTQNLFNILRRNGHQAYVVTTNAVANHLEYKDNVLYIPGLELKKLYGYRMASFYNSRATKIIQSWKLDIVHIQTEAGIGIFGKIVATRGNLPTVNTYHTMYEDYTHYAGKGEHFDRFAKSVVRVFSKYVAMQCTEFISPSEKTKEAFRQYGTDRYINIVPTGIEFSKFKRENINLTELEDFKLQHGINDKFVILALGRVAEEKSIDVLIRGYATYLKQATRPSKFVIVGDGPAKGSLMKLAGELGIGDHVLFVGAVSSTRVPFFYQLADVFVSASITETQGLTFMEAMASRLLVLTRYDDNLRNTIIDNETGFFFASETDFPEKLARLATLPATTKEKIIKTALKTLDVYSIERFYDNIMEVYHRALRKYF
ncbi:MAG TPA: glycosyl transferase family 1 [Firmicutes bacterium]|nr:glycosyl transferase family 1 [Bacillota bacterium]